MTTFAETRPVYDQITSKRLLTERTTGEARRLNKPIVYEGILSAELTFACGRTEHVIARRVIAAGSVVDIVRAIGGCTSECPGERLFQHA